MNWFLSYHFTTEINVITTSQDGFSRWNLATHGSIPQPLTSLSGYTQPHHFSCFHSQLLEILLHYKYLHDFTIFPWLTSTWLAKYIILASKTWAFTSGALALSSMLGFIQHVHTIFTYKANTSQGSKWGYYRDMT